MSSIRARLTTAYAIALTGTMALFAGTLWIGRGASGYRELQRYVLSQANVAARLLQHVGGVGLPLTEVADSLIGPQIVPSARGLLDVLPDFIVVTDSSGRIVYQSREVRRLVPGEVERIVRAAEQLDLSRVAAVLEVTRDTTG